MLARIYRLPATWAKYLSFDTCFRSIVSFGDPHYLSRTSPHSIHCAWNSRIWNFEFRKKLFATNKSLKFCFLQRFRPVHIFGILLLAYAWPRPYECPSSLSNVCMVCVMIYTYTHVFVYFLLFPKLNRHLCYGVYWCNIPLLISQNFHHFVICTSTIIWSLYRLSPPNK